MTTPPFQDALAIDTNVFVHIRNIEEWNSNLHIHHLLGVLVEEGVKLLVDDRNAIQREYATHVIPMLEGASVSREEAYLLQYFMGVDGQRKVAVDRRDRLMAAITQVIFERSKDADRTFVYVAFKQGKILVSNDVDDIVVGPERERRRTARRDRLLREAKRWLTDGADILTSQESHDKIQEQKWDVQP